MEAFIQISDLNRISLVKYSKETDENASEELIVIEAKKNTEEPTIKPNAREDLHNIIFIQVLFQKYYSFIFDMSIKNKKDDFFTFRFCIFYKQFQSDYFSAYL
jgi:hypothetical protein